MRLFDLVIKSVIKRRKDYFGFYLASAFSVMVFHVFVGIFYTENTRLNLGQFFHMEVLFKSVAIIITLFSVIFIVYSALLMFRKKQQEIATYALLGMDTRRISLILAAENLIVGCASIITGILAGLLFQKYFTMLLFRLMRYEIRVEFHVTAEALLYTVGTFLTLYILSALVTIITVHRTRLIKLFTTVQRAEPLPAPIKILIGSIIAAASLAFGYYRAIRLDLPLDIPYLIRILALTIVGTYFLFGSALPGLLTLLRRHALKKGRSTALIALGRLLFQIRKTSAVLATIAILNAVGITALGTIYTMQIKQQEDAVLYPPYSFSFMETDREATEAIIKETRTLPGGANLRWGRIDYIGFHHTLLERFTTDAVISLGTYRSMRAAKPELPALSLGTNETALFYPRLGSDETLAARITGMRIPLANTEDLIIAATGAHHLLTSYEVAMVVTDDQYAVLRKAVEDPGCLRSRVFIVIDDPVHASEIEEYLMDHVEADDFQSYLQVSLFMFAYTGLFIFIGTFISIVLIMANGSIIYFRQVMDAHDAVSQFVLLDHLGLSEKERRLTTIFQLGLVFFLPLLTGVLHSFMALNMLSLILEIPIIKGHLILVGLYFLIYSIYYVLNAGQYERILQNGIRNGAAFDRICG